jgi:hypothetical protein
MTTTFSTILANDLDEIQMNAGDEQEFSYTVYDSSGSLLDIGLATCSVSIFKYGDPENLLLSLPGSVSGSAMPGIFTAAFPSGSSINLSGVYQQQPKVVDYLGGIHTPSRGKIIIFPSPTS